MAMSAGARAALTVSLAGAGTGAAIAFLAWGPLPLGGDDWRWFRVPLPAWERALAPLGVYALIGIASLLAYQRAARLGRHQVGMLVAILAALAFVAQLLAARQLPGDYNESIIALGKPGANRYHAAAREVKDLVPVLRDYHNWMRTGPAKLIVTHPAGPLSLFWCLNQAYAGREAAAEGFVRWCEDWLSGGTRLRGPGASPATAALFTTMTQAELAGVWLATFVLRLAAALAVIPVFAMASRLYGRQAGFAAAAFAAVVPSFLVFSPGIDQAFPALAATACWLSWRAAEERSLWRAALAGAVVSLGLFFSLSFAVVAGWAGLLAVAGLFRGGERPRLPAVARLAGAAAAGFALPVLLLHLAVGYNSPAVWLRCAEANARFNAESGRAYWRWLLLNPLEFVVFVGPPAACLFLGRAASAARALWGGARPEPVRGAGHGSVREADWPTLIIAGLLVALDIVGLNRGETPRLWMFLMPGCLVAAAGQLERLAPYRRAVFACLFAFQALQATAFKSLLDALSGMYRSLG